MKIEPTPIYAVSFGDKNDLPETNVPMWLVRGGNPRELAVLAALTEFTTDDVREAVGAHGVLRDEDNGAVRFTVHYFAAGGIARYGQGDSDTQTRVRSVSQVEADMYCGPGYLGTFYESPDHIEYAGGHREIARLAVHTPWTIRRRVLGSEAIEALAGEDGVDQPAISRVGWLKTLLDEIDASPEIMAILERDDGEGLIEMLRECRKLANEGMKIVRARHEQLYPEPEGDPDELPLQSVYPSSKAEAKPEMYEDLPF